MAKELIEYRVRPVTRYVITRFEGFSGPDGGGGCTTRGEYDNADVAYEVAYALAKLDHENKGWLPGDERIQYPRHPEVVSSQEFSAPVAGVLAGASHLSEVAVIGIEEDGEVYVASSMGTPQTLALFGRARSRIDEIAAE